MTTEPNTPLIRMRDIIAWLNVTKKEVLSWVDCGLIHPVYKRRGARAWYHKQEIKENLLHRL